MEKESSLVKPFSIKKVKKNKNLEYAIILPLDPFGRKEFKLNNEYETFYFLNFKFMVKGKVLVVSPSFGPSQTVFLMECLIESGVKNFILLGSCGSIEGSKSGDVVVPKDSYSFVSITDRYFPGENIFNSSLSLNYFLKAKLKEVGVDFVCEGRVGTIDAVFRETPSFLKSISEKNCVFLDMESAPAFCLGKFHGVNVSSLMVILDEIFLDKGKRKVGFLSYLIKMRKVVGIIEKIS